MSERDHRFVRLLAIQEPDATIVEIATASGVNISYRLIGDMLQQGNLWVPVSRRKPWYTHKNRQQRKEFVCRHSSQPKESWWYHIYTNEVYLQICNCSQRRKVHHKPRTQFEKRHLASTFTGKPLTIQFFAAFVYTGHTQLFPIRKREEQEHTSSRDKLGFNSIQYVNEILISHLLPLYEKMGGTGGGFQTIEDRASYHTSQYTRMFRYMNGIHHMDWAPLTT